MLLNLTLSNSNVGGYSHAPDDLAYGVDMKVIRWCGILQVRFIYQTNKLVVHFIHLGLNHNRVLSLCLTIVHQRIALVYFVVALIEVFTIKVRPATVRSGPYAIFDAYRWQWYSNISPILVLLHCKLHIRNFSHL